MPTLASISWAFSMASFLLAPVWKRYMSAIWPPMVMRGFREVIGSWKIMEMSVPRIFSISRLERVSSSLPSKRMLPRIRLRWGLCKRRMDLAVMDLPQPDSPTTP